MTTKNFLDSAPRVIMSREIETQRAAKMSAPQPCYNGQWTVHPSHQIKIYVQAWLGGGTEMVTCPGVTAETTLQARDGR